MSVMPDKLQLNKLTIWSIAIPIFIEFVLTFSVFFTDTIFLSKISDLAAASVGAVIPVFMVFVLFFMMMAQGSGSVAAQYLGGQQYEKAIDSYMTGVAINILFGVLGTAMLMLIACYLGNFIGMSNDSIEIVDKYLMVVSPAIFLIAIKASYNAVLFSQGKTLWNMITAIIVNLSNILFNMLFIIGFFGLSKLGIIGVALSTVISQILAVLFLIYMVHYKLKIHFKISQFRERTSKIYTSILAIGVPASIEPISSELGMFIISIFAIHISIDAMAARTYLMNLLTLVICWSAALAVANQVLVAHRVGAKNFEDADYQLRSNIIKATLGSFLIMAVLYVFSRNLIGIFTTNIAILSMCSTVLALGFIIEPARTISTMSGYALRGSGDAKFPTVMAIVST
ncbi:MAG TPA: MATE family efflux transporter, partial [Burkholderiales bacterium]|nr:MATE family efflux transporter [Burkholderiales bacterium]